MYKTMIKQRLRSKIEKHITYMYNIMKHNAENFYSFILPQGSRSTQTILLHAINTKSIFIFRTPGLLDVHCNWLNC